MFKQLLGVQPGHSIVWRHYTELVAALIKSSPAMRVQIRRRRRRFLRTLREQIFAMGTDYVQSLKTNPRRLVRRRSARFTNAPAWDVAGSPEINCTHPEFDQEEGILGTLAVKLLQASFLFGEFVVNLANVHRFQQGVTVGVICLSDVYKQVLVVLQKKRERERNALESIKCYRFTSRRRSR